MVTGVEPVRMLLRHRSPSESKIAWASSLCRSLGNCSGDLPAHFGYFFAQQTHQPGVIAWLPAASVQIDRPASNRSRAVDAGNRPMRTQHHVAIIIALKALYPDPDIITVIDRRCTGRKPIGSDSSVATEVFRDGSRQTLIEWFGPPL